MRIAAVGDIHLGQDCGGRWREALAALPGLADVLLLAGDLTRHGTAVEAAVVAAEFGDCGVPVVAVLGNHDYHSDVAAEVTALLTEAGIIVLEGSSVRLDIDGVSLGIAGTKGFGGGFAGKCASAFGEPLMREFARHSAELAASLDCALAELETDFTVALTHYSPVSDTLHGEPPEIYPFLGSYLLGEAVDNHRVDLAVHGHAHAGTEHGTTPGGTRVRNVAHPVLRAAYAVYELAAQAETSEPQARDHSLVT
ncbi:metallophosphoesterase family protein [Nocardia bovistercoris]|uniref:Metallophosphoesterase n=1 Tax=Nocardia bovistercoris TaxID=2785916 RepID=A0A931N7M3_9NOCA|nr:metallophosphoesterase [Nocardia bovistercoris]MBH0781776.1 metallophosphoesterase [Nocardia bovistercoris]